MGKVIKFKDHFVKDEDLTVGQIHALYHYIKWKVARFRRWTAAQKADSESKKPRLVSPK